jgi:hypothetical protein
VSDVAIYTSAKRLVVPSPAEGFDTLFRDTILRGGTFDVRPL